MTKTKTRPVADIVLSLSDCDGKVTEDFLYSLCIEDAPDHASMENLSIGSYEFQGQCCYDHQPDFVNFEGFTIAIDVTGASINEDDYAGSASGTATMRSHEDSDEEPEFEWSCTFTGMKNINGKTYLMYNVN